MNQKPNNGGNMQNYIPKGNGEHSGEYTYKNITAKSYLDSKNGANLDKSYEIRHITRNKTKLRNAIIVLKDNNIPNAEEILDELYYINVEVKRDYQHLLEDVITLDDLIKHAEGMERIYGAKSSKLKALLKDLQDGKINIDDFNNYYVAKKIKGKHSIYDDLTKVNPFYETSTGYRYNCIYCVITLLFRRFKNLDVTAKPATITRSGVEVEKLEKILGYRQEITIRKKETKKDILKRIKEFPDKCFFLMESKWKDDDTGHAIAIEKNGDTILFLDPQKGKMVDDSFFNEIDSSTTKIFRIDDIDYDDNVLTCYKSGE